MGRVVILGLDAASPALVRRWLADLPNIRRLTEEGTWGVLHSTVPPLTFPAWPCMVTGMNPAKVGIFGLRYRREGAYRFSTPNSTIWRGPAVWEVASNAGLRVIVFNVPGTYPPSKVNGLMVSGGPAAAHSNAVITYPEGLKARLDRVVDGYRIGLEQRFDDGSRGDQVEAWRRLMEHQQQALEYLMDTEPWNLVFAVSMALDRICHSFWKYLDPQHPDYDPEEAARFGDVIRSVYVWEDRRLGRIMERMRPEDLLLVVSDHGSAPKYQSISINRWLIDNGYLVLEDGAFTRGSHRPNPFLHWALSLHRRHGLIRRLTRPLRQTRLRDAVADAHFIRSQGQLPLHMLPIDWSLSSAFHLGGGCIYLNAAGREPEGIVKAGADYERLRARIATELMALANPDDGSPLFAQAYVREEIYDGPFLAGAPDLITVPADPRWGLGGAVGNEVLEPPGISGTHHPEGIFMAWGRDVAAAQMLEASILDIAPTALHALGLPVPQDCDGSVQLPWYAPDSVSAARPVTTEKIEAEIGKAYAWTPEEEAEVEAHLRGLGYLD